MTTPWSKISPPQTPQGSALVSAEARHAALAGHEAHSAFALSRSSGRSAKNRSGSPVWQGRSSPRVGSASESASWSRSKLIKVLSPPRVPPMCSAGKCWLSETGWPRTDLWGGASSRGYTTAAAPALGRVGCRGRRRALSWVLPQLPIPGRTQIADRRFHQMPQGCGTFMDARGCTGIRDTGGTELAVRIDLHVRHLLVIAASSWRGGGCQLATRMTICVTTPGAQPIKRELFKFFFRSAQGGIGPF